MQCRTCKYVLDGLTVSRCPECGQAFDVDNPRSYIPGEAPTAEPPADIACAKCGYELAGMTNDNCPECGEPFTPRPTKPGTLPRTSSQLGGLLRRLVRRRRGKGKSSS